MKEENILQKTWNSLTWIFAIKCSVSLGFAVLLGAMYNKEKGYWSGLIVAISVVTGRQATFTVSNARAQGTAMGSVYGLICCFLLQRFEDTIFLPLLPWIIFTGFLRHSRMYGHAGGVSAAIGALLLLGRKYSDPPSEFAIKRLTEVSIGLICFVLAESLVQPARAATLSNSELRLSLTALRDCIRMSSSGSVILRENLNKKLKTHVERLEKFVAEANLEPNFWFSPFHGDYYCKFLESLRRINDLLQFTAYGLENLSGSAEKLRIEEKELKNIVRSLLKWIDDMISDKFLGVSEEQNDVELGNLNNKESCRRSDIYEETNMEMMGSFIKDLAEETEKDDEYEEKKKMIISTSSLAFCTSRIVKETKELEKQVKELFIEKS